MDNPEEKAPERRDSVPSFSGNNTPNLVASRNASPARKSMSGKASTDENKTEHTVSVTVTVALAYVQTSEESVKLMDDLIKKNKRTVEAPKPQQFFHCEYTVAPGHEPTICDIVTYGVAAKLFTETDSRVVKTWDDNGVTWVAWNHSHDVVVTEENVPDLYNHVIDLHLWDSKEKVSSKARFDRPKAFRLPSQKGNGAPGRGVAAVVAKQSQSWSSLQPKDSALKNDLPGLEKMLAETKHDEHTGHTEQQQTLPPARIRSSLGRLAGLLSSANGKRRIEELKLQQSYLMNELSKHRKPASGKHPGKQPNDVSRRSSLVNRKTHDGSHSATIKSKSTNIAVKLESLFGNRNDVTFRLEEKFASVQDMFVGVAVNGHLLPDWLEKSLNPMLIKIKSVKDLPNTPIPREHLSQSCQPVYCKYHFPFNPVYSTKSRPHSRDVYFEDEHVILAGKLEPGKLFEFLQSNHLLIEVHDRDRTIPEVAKHPMIFGEETDDKKIGNVGLVTGKKTTHNAFHDRQRIFDPYGVAKLHLADLLRGHRILNFHIVVKPCATPNILSDPNKPTNTGLVGITGAVDRPENPPLPPGDYIHEGTVLKVRVELRYPLQINLSPENTMNVHSESCPYTRIICHFDYSNKSLLRMVDHLVKEANAKALNLDKFEDHVIDAALATYKLSTEQKENKFLDIVTGFHVIDGVFNFFVLEGLRNGAIGRIINEFEAGRKNGEIEDVTVLYDSSYMFSSRLYVNLDVTLCTVRLHQPLNVILQQPLLYVRDLVPQPCFECLTRVKTMLEIKQLKDACFSSLFPSYEMVISMSKEFGIPISYNDFEDGHDKEKDELLDDEIKGDLEDQNNLSKKSSRHEKLDNTNESYVKAKQSQESVKSNFVLENMISVQDIGKRKRPKPIMIYGVPQNSSAHNYSTQTLNSMELAKNMLRRMLYERDSDSRYAYNEKFNSSMIEPVSWEEHYRMLDDEEKRKWRTGEGFVYPGVKPSFMCNQHDLRPATSRIEELRLRWRENVLHANVLEPTLKQREKWKWADRFRDMELFQQPTGKFGSDPLSIHLPGEKRLKEKMKAERHDKKMWKSKIVVDDITMKFHRVGVTTEQTNKSNQIDKLDGLLKDEPVKYSLKIIPAHKLPPLSVVGNPSVDMKAGEGTVPTPSGRYTDEKHVGFMAGPYDNLSWKRDKNRIAIRDPEHKLFEEIHGADFDAKYYQHDYLWKKRHAELGEVERNTHYFKIPPLEHTEDNNDEEELKQDTFSLRDNRKTEYRDRFDEERNEVNKLVSIYPSHTYEGIAMGSKLSPFKSDISYKLIQNGDENNTNEEQIELRSLIKQHMADDNSVMLVKEPVHA